MKYVPAYALRISWRGLRILISLLSEHNTQNPLSVEKKSDPLCPLCEEEMDTSLHFLGRCYATINR